MASPNPRTLRNNMLRMLWRRATWQEAWLNLKRAHKDPRARKRLMGLVALILLVILAPVTAIVYAAFVIGSGAWVLVPFVVPVIWWIRRSARRESAPISITPQPEPVTFELTGDQHHALRSYFAELALVFAVVADRTGSEHFLKQGQLPEGAEIASRRVHLDLLRSAGLWERIAQEDREALMMADGHWSLERIHRTVVEIEPLRLLRWILRIDFYLPVIGQQLQADFRVAHELVVVPQKVKNGNSMVEADSVRTARDAARHYFLRCLAEAITRGYHTPENEDTVAWAKQFSAELSGRQDADLVLGTTLVSEATKEQVLWATSLARTRRDFLDRVLEILGAGRPPEIPFPGICKG